MEQLDRRGFRLGFAAFVLFTGIAGDFWRNSLSWYGYGALVVVIVAVSIALLVRNRARFTLAGLPFTLIAFLLLATLSIAWSFYPLYTTLGATVQLITTAAAVSVVVTLSWAQLLRVLGWVFRAVLGLSFLFEFVVSVFFRHPIYPVWIAPEAHPAALLYWSRDLLFASGKIQGIVGNSSLLAMAALLAVIVFAIQLASRSVGRVWGWFWIIVAVLTIALTRSATILIAIPVVGLVAIAVLLVRRARDRRARMATYTGIGIGVVLIAVVGFVLRDPILGVLGKSDTLTGRQGIWDKVIALAQERPGFGWGWLSYWIPWIAPFKGLIRRGGVEVAHAHNAWLDVWLQLGILGLIVFAALVLTTLLRSWIMATDGIITKPGTAGRLTWVAMLPILMLTAQLVQSVAESRMLLEGGWMLLVIWAVKTKLGPLAVEPASSEHASGERGRR
jgi:exopolysaccharide production protein ExoQ